MAGLLASTKKSGLLPASGQTGLNVSLDAFRVLSPNTGSVAASTPSVAVPKGTSGFFPASVAAPILQAPVRAGAALVETGRQLASGRPEAYEPNGLLAKLLVGSEVKSLQGQGAAVDQYLTSKGISPKVSGPLAAFGVVGLTALDLTPLGGAKNAYKSIAAVKDISEAAKLARSIGIADDLLADVARTFVGIKDAAQAKKYVESLATLQKTTKPSAIASLVERTEPTLLPKARQASQPVQIPLREVTSYIDDAVKIANTSVNTERLAVSRQARGIVERVVEEVKPAIEAQVGRVLTNAETVKQAERASDVLTRVVGREETLDWQASMLRSRQYLAAASESGKVDEAYIKNLLAIKTQGSDIARKLQSLSINAEGVEPTVKDAILEAVLEVNDNLDEILKAAQGVDFNDLQQATTFYRTFVKPKATEWLDLIRYNSMLSSPKTHVVNIFSNLLNTSLIAPFEKALTGGLDFLGSKITGNARKAFAGEGGAYMAGYLKSVAEATFKFADVMRGKAGVTNLDTRNIPIATKGVKGAVVKTLSYPTRLLEGMDQFFMTLGEGAGRAALKYRAAKGGKVGNIETEATREAQYRVFRQKPLDPSQGGLLDAVDRFTVMIQSLRNNKNPIVSTISKFTVPFIQTPMNIFKQGIEYSPVGVLTIPGAANKTEQLSKAIIGSSMFAGAATLLASDRLSWGEPTDASLKAAFRAAGKQSYSVKIGDTWYSYQKLPPGVAFPLAMVAGLNDVKQNAGADDTFVEQVLSAVAKYGEFLADQSYAKSIGDLLSAVKGGEAGIERIISNYGQQLVPYRALGGWLARLLNDTQRKVDSSASFIDQQVQLLMMNIPGLSQKVPARLDAEGNPIPQQKPVRNAFSPIQSSDENSKAADYQTKVDLKKLNKETTAARDKLSDRAAEEFSLISGMASPQAKKDYLNDLARENPDLAKKVIELAKDKSKGLSTGEQSLINAPVATRAKYIVQELNKLQTPEEKKALLKNYATKKILTEDTLKLVVKLLKQ